LIPSASSSVFFALSYSACCIFFRKSLYVLKDALMSIEAPSVPVVPDFYGSLAFLAWASSSELEQQPLLGRLPTILAFAASAGSEGFANSEHSSGGCSFCGAGSGAGS